MNPYASFLGDRDPLEVIRSTPARIESLITQHGAETLDRAPAPGKWSVRDILSHLADCEIVFAFRLRQALAEDYHVFSRSIRMPGRLLTAETTWQLLKSCFPWSGNGTSR